VRLLITSANSGGKKPNNSPCQLSRKKTQTLWCFVFDLLIAEHENRNRWTEEKHMPSLNVTASVIILALTTVGTLIAACVLFAGAFDANVLSPAIEIYKAFLALALGLTLVYITTWAEKQRSLILAKSRSGRNR